MIDYENLEPIYEKIRPFYNDFVVYSVQWGPNWGKGEMSEHIKKFGRKYIPVHTYCKTNCETFVRVDRLNASHKLAVLLLFNW